jgi:hypothetical protein
MLLIETLSHDYCEQHKRMYGVCHLVLDQPCSMHFVVIGQD